MLPDSWLGHLDRAAPIVPFEHPVCRTISRSLVCSRHVLFEPDFFLSEQRLYRLPFGVTKCGF